MTLLDRSTVDADQDFAGLSFLKCNIATETDGDGRLWCRLFTLSYQLAADIIDAGIEDDSIFGNILQSHLNTDAVAIKQGAANQFDQLINGQIAFFLQRFLA